MARKSNHPAVLNGGTSDALVLRTSVSALTAFDELSYAGCNRRWWFTRVAGVKEDETVAQGIGKEGHAQAEHYEKTGEDILGPVMRAGRKFLLTGPDVVVEAQFGDLNKAIELRKVRAATQEIEQAAGLCANGIPLDGYIDFRHARGEYIDGNGTVQKEDPRHGHVVEVGDHKTTSSIENFSKSSVEMASTIQMIGYANYVLNLDPKVDHVRLSHIYYQTRGALAAKKVTALVSVEAARAAWQRVHVIGAKMEGVARASRVEEVEPNVESCKAYRGCPHVSRCPVTRTFALGTTGGRSMSLFSKTPTNGTTPQPAAASGSLFGKKVAASPEYDAAKIAEKAKLAAADASYGTCMCGAALTGQNTSKLQSGQIVHIGCPRAGVTPPDAPKTTLATAAAPLTAEQISKVEDPEIRQRATEHAALHAQHSAQQPATETKGGRCPKAGERVLMNEKQKMSRSITCTCGKEYKKIKDEQIDIQDTGVYWLVPSHNLPKIETPAVVAASASVATPVVAPVAAPVATAVAQQSMILYVDVVVERGLQPTPLEDYITNIVRTIEKQGNVPDLRFAPNGHELAFGRWKGALAACVRFTPPQPGAYFVSSSNSEIKQVVIEALIPFCDAVYRGVR